MSLYQVLKSLGFQTDSGGHAIVTQLRQASRRTSLQQLRSGSAPSPTLNRQAQRRTSLQQLR